MASVPLAFPIVAAANTCSGIQRTVKTKAPAPSMPFRNPRRLLAVSCSSLERFSMCIMRPHRKAKMKRKPGSALLILPPTANLATQQLGGRPFSQRAAQIHKLAEMIGIVVGEEQSLTQYRLTITMGNLGIQIGLRVFHQADYFSQVALKRFYGFIPRSGIGRPRRLRPVAFGKTRRNVLGVAAELQDVPLRDARMLQELPPGVRESGDEGSALCFREILDGIHEMDVRPASFQEVDHVVAQCFVAIARSCFFAGYRLFLGGRPDFFLHIGDSYFSETRTCCGMSGTGCKVVFVKPALPNIFSYCTKV